MKQRLLIAAGLLCLGTGPAFAFTIPTMAPDMAKAVKAVWTDQYATEKASVFDTGEAWMSSAAASKDMGKFGPTEPLMQPTDKPVDTTLAGELGGTSLPLNKDKVTSETADAVAPAGAQYTGVGGPLEEVDYPPCSRTVTDRCIQLYERGVHR